MCINIKLTHCTLLVLPDSIIQYNSNEGDPNEYLFHLKLYGVVTYTPKHKIIRIVAVMRLCNLLYHICIQHHRVYGFGPEA